MSWADRARASTAQSGTRNGARRRYVAPPWYRVDFRRHAWRDVRKHPWRARSWLFLAPTAPRRHPLPLLRGPLHLWLRLGWMRSSPLLGRRPPAGRRLRRSRRTPGSRLPCTAWWYVPGKGICAPLPLRLCRHCWGCACVSRAKWWMWASSTGRCTPASSTPPTWRIPKAWASC